MALEWDDADPLPTDVPTLHAMVRELRTELSAVRAELAAVNAKLDKLLAVTFRRSERTKRPRTPPPVADRPPRPRHRHGRAALPEHLERRVDRHDLTAEQRLCPCCGHDRVRIGEQAAEQLDCDPIRYFVRRTIRVSYACHHCDPTTVPPDQRVTTAGPSTVGPIPKGLCGPGLLAYTLTSKYADHRVQGEAVHEMRVGLSRSGCRTRSQTAGELRRSRAVVGSVLGNGVA